MQAVEIVSRFIQCHLNFKVNPVYKFKILKNAIPDQTYSVVYFNIYNTDKKHRLTKSKEIISMLRVCTENELRVDAGAESSLGLYELRRIKS